jgi:hypothetical protein
MIYFDGLRNTTKALMLVGVLAYIRICQLRTSHYANRGTPALVNLLKPTGHVMHQQFNIQQLYVLPTLYLCVLYLSENKQRLVPPTALTDWFL